MSAPVRLVVEPRGEEQFGICTHAEDLRVDPDFEATYVCMSGYCGPYSPHLFAAAPKLLQALQATYEALCISYPLHSVDMDKRAAVLAAARDAIADASRQPEPAAAQLEAA